MKLGISRQQIFPWLFVAMTGLALTWSPNTFAKSTNEFHITVPISAKTRVNLNHTAGDKVVLLKVKGAPTGFLKSLQERLGNTVDSVERIERKNGLLSIRIRLHSPKTRVSVRNLGKPATLLLSFFPAARRPMPRASSVVGQLSGIYTSPKFPMLTPRIPRNTPCADSRRAQDLIDTARKGKKIRAGAGQRAMKHAQNANCRSFIRSLLAEHSLRREENFDQHERWAFEQKNSDPWKQDEYNYQRTLLIAAEVLMRQELFPEAESLLMRIEKREDRGMRPYIAMAKARLFGSTDRVKEALDVLRTYTLAMKRSARWQYAAYLTHAIIAMNGKDLLEVMEVITEADKKLSADRRGSGQLWLIGAEAAAGLDDLDTAIPLFRRAVDEGTSWQSGLAQLRLGDMSVKLRGDAGISRAKTVYWSRIRGPRKKADVAQLLRIRDILGSLNTSGRDPLRSLKNIRAGALTPAVDIEASYAIARIMLEHGNPEKALQNLSHILEKSPDAADLEAMQSLTSEVVNAWLRKLARHGSWVQMVEVYESSLKPYHGYLERTVVRTMADAYNELEQYDKRIDLLLGLLNKETSETEREDLILGLWDGYVQAQDPNRAELVEKYFHSRYPKSKRNWRFKMYKAEELIRQGKAEQALRILRSIRKQVPGGDTTSKMRLARVEALSALKRMETAATELKRLLGDQSLDPIDFQRIGNLVLSGCARSCKKKSLQRLIQAASQPDSGLVVSDRIRFLAAQKGVVWPDPTKKDGKAGSSTPNTDAPDGQVEQPNVWKELMDLAPDLAETKKKKSRKKRRRKVKKRSRKKGTQ
ncbi:MAG: hypothetical protein CMH54_00425 [Myxococcales bacterium]|nr:hypothetical protein [Myxococcales bacterium]